MPDWDAMREELMRLTTTKLRELAKDEGIPLGTDRNWKETTVHRIVAERKHRAEGGEPTKPRSPWRSYRIKRSW